MCSRIGLALAVAGLWPLAVLAQQPDTKKGKAPAPAQAPAKPDTKAPAKAPGADATKSTAADLPQEEQEAKGVVDVTKAKKALSVETFVDPRNEALLPFDKFQALPAVRGGVPTADDIKKMATRAIPLNRDQVQRFVDAQAANLTNHTNLKAIVDPPEGRPRREFDQAADALREPLQLPPQVVDPQFRSTYHTALLKTLPKLLNNHLFARTEAMTLLAMMENPDAVPLFTRELNDENQVSSVKDWAAKGLTLVTQKGRRDIDLGKATAAAKAVSDFLQREQDTPWPVQLRGLEALGSLRLGTDPQGQGMAEMANTALRFVADGKARPRVRAAAAWALGMMKLQQVPSANYPLIAYYLGTAAADTADQLDEAYGNNQTVRATALVDLLVTKYVPALKGEDGVRESGLLNMPNIGNARKPVTEVANQVQAIAVAGFNLTFIGTPRNDRAKYQKEVETRVAALRDYLKKNAPSNRRLVPSGPEMPAPEPQVTGGGG